MSITAMKQALEALTVGWNPHYSGKDARELGEQAITALRTAIAEAEKQEPVAWYDEEMDCAYTASELDGGTADGLVPLFLAAGAQPYSDSTAELSVGDSSFESWYASYVKEGTKGLKHHCRDAYAAGMGDPLVAPPQAQSDHIATTGKMVQPLTEKEIHHIWRGLVEGEGIEEFARAIEQAHGIGERP